MNICCWTVCPQNEDGVDSKQGIVGNATGTTNSAGDAKADPANANNKGNSKPKDKERIDHARPNKSQEAEIIKDLKQQLK